MFYLIYYIQNVISMYNQYKNLIKEFTFFHTKSLKLVCILHLLHNTVQKSHISSVQ